MKLEQIKHWIDQQLRALDLDPGQIHAEREILMAHYLGVSPEQVILEPDREVDERREAFQQLSQALDRRVSQRVPVQYLTGEAWFMGLPFAVSPAVLIPRPETEILVEHAVAMAQAHHTRRILDVGTGSGCIAVCLKKALPHAEVTAVDISQEALAVARENARRHETAIRFMQGAWFDPVCGETFDMIVSNPPYIAAAQKAALMPEVLCEPDYALFSPEDPAEMFSHLIVGARAHLNVPGLVLLEMGDGQAPMVESIARDAGFETSLIQDYAHTYRVLAGVLLNP